MIWFYVVLSQFCCIFGKPMSIVQVSMIYVVDDSRLHAVYHDYVFGN